MEFHVKQHAVELYFRTKDISQRYFYFTFAGKVSCVAAALFRRDAGASLVNGDGIKSTFGNLPTAYTGAGLVNNSPGINPAFGTFPPIYAGANVASTSTSINPAFGQLPATDTSLKSFARAIQETIGFESEECEIDLYVVKAGGNGGRGGDDEYRAVTTDAQMVTYLNKYFDAVDALGVGATAEYWVVVKKGAEVPKLPWARVERDHVLYG